MLRRVTQQAKNELLAALDHKEAIPKNIGICLARYLDPSRHRCRAPLTFSSYRSECDKEIMNDQEIVNNQEPAREHDTEQILWDFHVRVHKRFQKVLHVVSCASFHIGVMNELNRICSTIRNKSMSNVVSSQKAT